MKRRLSRYLLPTQGKILIWGIFIVPLACTMIAFSGTLPLSIARPLIVGLVVLTAPARNTEVKPSQVVPTPLEQGAEFVNLVLGYLLITYVFSCVFVDISGTMRGSKKRTVQKVKRTPRSVR